MAARKGGHDCDFVNDPPKDLECAICLLTLREPHVITCCGNQFCRPCIERVQRDRKPCPLCNDQNYEIFIHKKVMREVNSLLVRCPHKELGCGWEGELGHLNEHLDPGAGQVSENSCGYVEVECIQKCGARFLRRELRDHLIGKCPKRSVEAVMASIVKRLDTLTVENQEIKAENQQLKLELAANKQSIVQLVGRVESLSAKTGTPQVKYALETTQAQRKESDETALTKELSIRLYRDADQKYTSLEDRFTPLPPFYFTVSNYEHFKRVDYEWRSDPFYTHRSGYKMQAQVFPNGFKGTHLALYVSIMRGDNDDKLKWPFTGRVTIQAYNREIRQWDNDCVISFSDSAAVCYQNKPPEDSISNGGWGYSSYISHSDVLKYYAAVNIIRFRVLKVEL